MHLPITAKHTGYIGPAYHHMYLLLQSHRFPQTGTSMHLLRVSCRRYIYCRKPIYPSMHPSIRVSIHSSIYPSIHVPIHPSTHPPMYPAIHPRTSSLLINERHEPIQVTILRRGTCRGSVIRALQKIVTALAWTLQHKNIHTRACPGPCPLYVSRDQTCPLPPDQTPQRYERNAGPLYAHRKD